MERNILVAYASTYGSTQEVAEVIAATLRASGQSGGLGVDVQPLRKVRSLEGYQAVVLGAPLYMFHLHQDLAGFLARFQPALSSGLPVALFAGGPIEAGKPEQFQDARVQLDRELAKFPWLAPCAIEIVGGKFDPARLRFPLNLLPALRNLPACDLRDWEAIRRWAGSLIQTFQPVLA